MVYLQKLKRYAAIDMGTNTFHLIIGEKCPNGIKTLYKSNAPVRLGEKSINEGYIGEPALNRAYNTLSEYKKVLEDYEVDSYRAVATAAVRSARNGAKFVDYVKEHIGIQIETIDGNEEAELIFEGIKSSGSLEGTSLIMDIGGGSTEFIIASPTEILWKKSYNLGAARLWQQHFTEDPMSEEKYAALDIFLEMELKELFTQCNIFKPSTLVGSAGSFETYLQMLDPEEDLSCPYKDLHLIAFLQIAEQLKYSTHAERQKIRGLIPLRVDMIVAASQLTRMVLQKTAIKRIKVTTYDLKMGLLHNYLKLSI